MNRSVLLGVLCALALTASACGGTKPTGFHATPEATETGPIEDTSTRQDPAEIEGPIDVVDNVFIPRFASVPAGTTVTWHQSGTAPHNVVADDGSFNSHPDCSNQDLAACMAAGDEFTQLFAEPGQYPYYCVIHGFPKRLDDPSSMSGLIIVE